jgi:hypothetical protein
MELRAGLWPYSLRSHTLVAEGLIH